MEKIATRNIIGQRLYDVHNTDQSLGILSKLLYDTDRGIVAGVRIQTQNELITLPNIDIIYQDGIFCAQATHLYKNNEQDINPYLQNIQKQNARITGKSVMTKNQGYVGICTEVYLDPETLEIEEIEAKKHPILYFLRPSKRFPKDSITQITRKVIYVDDSENIHHPNKKLSLKEEFLGETEPNT